MAAMGWERSRVANRRACSRPSAARATSVSPPPFSFCGSGLRADAGKLKVEKQGVSSGGFWVEYVNV